MSANEMIRSDPGKGKRRLSYDESVDEPARFIADEPVDVEAEIPADNNEPVETIDEDDRVGPPMFDK